MAGELDGKEVKHGEMKNFGELSAYYHMDIAEIEYKDLTDKMDVESQPGVFTIENGNPVYIGYKFR